MTNQNSRVKLKLLVLLDLSRESYMVLRNAVNLAKTINGSIEIFYVKSPRDVVKCDNQLSAMSDIDEESYVIKKKLKNLANLFSQEENISIIFDFAFGNVKNEIVNRLEKTNPDIVVLGKRKKKPFNFLGDDVTQFLLSIYSGIILIGGEVKGLQSGIKYSIGFYNVILDDDNVEITKKLSKKATNPVKFFRVRKKSESNTENIIAKGLKIESNFENTIEYVFEEGSNAINALVDYVSKNNIDLLCMGRGSDKRDGTNRFIDAMSEVQKTIQKLNIPLLIM